MEALRNEIIEAQKARTDLFKWKLILVAGLGAAGLGLGDASAVPQAKYVVALIPLVCVYCDVLCRHLNLRMIVIHDYFHLANHKGCDLSQEAYEEFAGKARRLTDDGKREAPQRGHLSAFDLEDNALVWSTGLLCTLVLVLGLMRQFAIVLQMEPHSVLYILSGAAGLVLTAISSRLYDRRCRGLELLVKEELRSKGCADGAAKAPAVEAPPKA